MNPMCHHESECVTMKWMAALPASLEALLTRVIDYAGLYPPAALPLDAVLRNYREYLASRDRWLLNRLVLPLSSLPEVQIQPEWRVTLLVAEEPGPLPPQVETLETKTPGRLSLPTYCEAPLGQIADAFAKVRTAAGDTPRLTAFLHEAAGRHLPFKATAGLHHPFRSVTMHGFVNVVAAAAFAWHGAEPDVITELLDEADPRSFQFFDDGLSWRGLNLSTAQITSARHEFAHSFGSCSFEEPTSDLRELGFLP
jgi:hypothetical protein